jgi:hypothetical protein
MGHRWNNFAPLFRGCEKASVSRALCSWLATLSLFLHPLNPMTVVATAAEASSSAVFVVSWLCRGS